MKRLTLLTALAATLTASAAHLTPQQALERALDTRHTPAARHAAAGADRQAYSYAGTHGSLYLFEGAGRTMVTTSDSRMRPVLAIIDAPTAEVAEMPEALSWWLSQYENEMAAAATAATAATPSTNYASWSAINPIMTCKWDQGSPYNAMCPNGTLTGCVATAMAQVIYTNRYAMGTRSHSYQWQGQTLTFDFAKTTFNFAAMTDTYDSNSTAESRQAVAQLMYGCGVGVNMYYSPGASSANPPEILTAATNFFGYDATHSALLWRQEYQTVDWEKIVYNELKAGRCVVYGGSAPNGGGHCFVVDGYSDNGLFHINWGWSGACDGFFALSALNPTDQGAGSSDGGYNGNQYAALMVKPGDKNPPVLPAKVSGQTDLSGLRVIDFTSPTGYYVGREASVNFTMVNTGTVDFNDHIHLGLYLGDVEYTYSERLNTVVIPGDVLNISMTIKLDGEKDTTVKPGAYTLRVQDHWRRTLTEVPVEVTEGTGNAGWQPGSMTCYVTNGDQLPATAISGSTWTHAPVFRCTSAQTATPGLNFYTPGTDKVAGTVTFPAIALPVGNALAYRWNNGSATVSIPWGEYDVCYTINGTQASARSRMRVGLAADGINYVPALTDGETASVAPGAYTGAVSIPATVHVAGKEREVTAIEELAFAYTGVTSVELPAGITAMGLNALRSTQSMRTVRFLGAKAPFEHEAYIASGMYHSATIYVPAEAYDDYAARVNSHKVYSYIESLTAPEEPVKLTPGQTITTSVGTQPASEHANNICLTSASPAGVVTARGFTFDSIMLTGVAPGTATVTVTPLQPGLKPVTFTVEVTDESAITEVNAESGSGERVYTIGGICVGTSTEGLPSGLYIITDGTRTRKVRL